LIEIGTAAALFIDLGERMHDRSVMLPPNCRPPLIVMLRQTLAMYMAIRRSYEALFAGKVVRGLRNTVARRRGVENRRRPYMRFSPYTRRGLMAIVEFHQDWCSTCDGISNVQNARCCEHNQEL
jgi:hypothetical protein